MGVLMILVGGLLVVLGIYRVVDGGEVTAWRAISILAAVFAVGLGVRLLLPDRVPN